MTTLRKILLSEAEAMEALGIGRSLLRRMWHEGHIQPVRIGRRILFHVEEIRRFAKEMQEGN